MPTDDPVAHTERYILTTHSTHHARRSRQSRAAGSGAVGAAEGCSWCFSTSYGRERIPRRHLSGSARSQLPRSARGILSGERRRVASPRDDRKQGAAHTSPEPAGVHLAHADRLTSPDACACGSASRRGRADCRVQTAATTRAAVRGRAEASNRAAVRLPPKTVAQLPLHLARAH
jgi:hypothetical protein